ncbi:MAG: hypothetical protein II604_06455, partial [Bacteroidales bacterium]|nr:hypothetical protein [Bacteroidales bacterium]
MSHLVKYLSLAIAVLLVSYNLLAQENSWINYNQQYFKIQVTKDGVYRVSTSQLVSADVPVNL